MKVYIDIDDTISITPPMKYELAQPIESRIKKVNKWYNSGHEITYWTARGTESGIDYTELTKSQLKKWGCKYHYLKMGKPSFDMLIDDKAFNEKEFEDIYI